MRIACLSAAPLALAVAVAGCADLALDPSRVPTSMVISPADTLVTEGHPAKLTLQVLDQDGNPMEGPPLWAPPQWVSSDPDAVEIAPDGTLNTLGGGDLKVTARSAGLETSTGLRINPSSLVLSAPAVYVNQAIQNVESGVPIIAGRAGFLRVFVTGDEISFYEPRVLVDFVNDGQVVFTTTMSPGSDVLPDEVQEGRLDHSFNAVVPGDVLQPGVGLVLELDLDGVVPKATGSQNRVPAEGVMPLNIVTMPLLEQTIVPVLLAAAPDERVFNWTQGTMSEGKNVELTRKLLPVGGMKVTVHEAFYTSSNLRFEGGWNRFLREIELMWRLEGSVGYYYGAVEPAQGFAYGGLGYVGRPISVGVTRDATYTHELGHNMNLRHAPCGGAGGPDPDFPYADGSSGQWGYDLARRSLVNPRRYKDVMGYCSPDWISDYHFVKAMDHRLEAEADRPSLAGGTAIPEKTLMLWGSAGNGEFLLEPAFLIDAPASLPAADGPYRLEGFGPDGLRHFSFAFTPDPVEYGGAHFNFTVPYDPERDGVLERVVLTGPEGEFVLSPGSTPPMAIITDRSSGQVRAILRDWSGSFTRLEGDTEIMVSDGLPGGVR